MNFQTWLENIEIKMLSRVLQAVAAVQETLNPEVFNRLKQREVERRLGELRQQLYDALKYLPKIKLDDKKWPIKRSTLIHRDIPDLIKQLKALESSRDDINSARLTASRTFAILQGFAPVT